MKEIERAIIKLKKSIYEPEEIGDSPHKTVINVGKVFNKIDEWYEKLQSELDRQENKSLTVEELEKMIGEPVYIFELDRWGVIGEKECVSFGKNVRKEFNRFVIGFSYGYEWLDDFKNRTFYKHKPKEVD